MIWSRKSKFSGAMPLKTEMILDKKEQMYWSSFLYGCVTRFSTQTMEIGCGCEKLVWTGPVFSPFVNSEQTWKMRKMNDLQQRAEGPTVPRPSLTSPPGLTSSVILIL